jgi:hypothetical protein
MTKNAEMTEKDMRLLLPQVEEYKYVIFNGWWQALMALQMRTLLFVLTMLSAMMYRSYTATTMSRPIPNS